MKKPLKIKGFSFGRFSYPYSYPYSEGCSIECGNVSIPTFSYAPPTFEAVPLGIEIQVGHVPSLLPQVDG